MIIKNWIEQLSKDEVRILVPEKHAENSLIDDLELHLINLGFNVDIIPCDCEVVVTTINQDTERRMDILGVLAYYKIPKVEYQLWIEQHNGTLFTNILFN